MVGRHRSRRGVGYGAQICGIATAFLLLLSIFLLYTRLSSSSSSSHRPNDNDSSIEDPLSLSLSSEYPLLSDSDPEPDPRITTSTSTSEDRIDVLDDKDVDAQLSNEEEILRALDDSDEDSGTNFNSNSNSNKAAGYLFDHVSLVIRHAIDGRSIDEIDYDNTINNNNNQNPFQQQQHPKHNCHVVASDDVPVDEDVRMKMMEVAGIEDALLLKSSPLRKGWGPWFDAKTDFLRKDKMFRSNFHLLNPSHHLLLQDPDSIGPTTLTKADKIVHKGLLAGRRIHKPPQLNQIQHDANNKTSSTPMDEKSRWGYFPGLSPFLSFSNFMDSFFRKCKCSMRVFMVWNSPSWMFTVRHQRGLESLLHHHPNACVVIFSETLELDFFKDFVNRSFKVAVAMPNLEQLLQDTPASVFASVWHEWRTTPFYPTHYSELIRLSALYKYGGIYLDSDMIVLKPLSPFSNSVGMEEQSPGSPLNGAVMAFTKHSSFLMQCMSEFYSTYDDNLKRWNGAELLTRVAENFSRKTTDPNTQQELKVQPSSVFFPISSNDIQRYFLSPLNESEKVEQDGLYRKAFKTVVTDPDSVLDQLTYQLKTTGPDGKEVTQVLPAVTPEIKDALIKNVRRRMTPHPLKIRADIQLQCFHFDGVLHIKDAMRRAEAAGTKDCPVKIKLVAPPLYVLTTQTLNKEQGISTLNKAIVACTEEIERHNGKITVKEAPRTVSERDDKLFQDQLEKLRQDNEEKGGDDDTEDEDEDEDDTGMGDVDVENGGFHV